MDTTSPPLISGQPLLGHFAGYRRDPASYFLQLHRRHGDIFSIDILGKRIVVVNSPQAVRRILQDAVDNYRKSRSYRHLKLLLGEGLLTSEGDVWHRSRRIAQAAFGKTQLAILAASVGDTIEQHLGGWHQRPGNRDFWLDATDDMLSMSLSVAGSALFGQALAAHSETVRQALRHCMAYVYRRMEAIVNPPAWLPTPRAVHFAHQKGQLLSIIRGMIETSPGDGEAGHLLGMLLQARRSDPDYGDQQLIDDVITLFLSGFETTATTLTWVLFLLAKSQAVQERLYQEVCQVQGFPAYQELGAFPYARAVLDETLRLYPPVWSFSRETNDTDILAGHRIDKDQMVVLTPYCLHRHPQWWPRPDAFDPGRFLRQRPEANTFIPFGSGQRHCIGIHFAYLEMLYFLIAACREYRFVEARLASPGFHPGITLRPRSNLLLRMEPRRGTRT
jgi:cytochrome P450